MEGTRKGYLCCQKCWAERRASPFKTLLCNPPSPSGLCEKREFLVLLLLPMLLCLKLKNTKIETHCFN